ncbi:unnamed protein product [Bursaphelenchus xylophilus]|uniref:(pine wood nematode) hypothetical protein n=1 Tax=Bursaphelenchus xylophilus TaxID=6326 RepID=A0A1I7SLP4_BURXY|nr:unnamed protein product [Bursaphelenchus xylophilus]CAG9129692.1 unnamed protein product [Bursaphelenchus xylophilus]
MRILVWQRDDASSDWSEWSDCDRSLTRTRWRNCSSCNPRRERVPCISKTSLSEEFPQELLNTEFEPKQVAQTFEDARRFKAAGVRRSDDHEGSLFGDNDYNHQDEVSYFGPPHKVETSGFIQSEDIIHPQPNIFNIQSNIKKIRPEEEKRGSGRTSDLPAKESFELDPNEAAPFAPLKPDDLDFLNGLDSGEMKQLKDAQNEAEKEANREVRGFRNEEQPEDITLQEIRREGLNIRRIDNKKRHEYDREEHKTQGEVSKDDFETKKEELDENGCNPRVKCCPVSSGATLKGCIIGFRTTENGAKATCLTDNCI